MPTIDLGRVVGPQGPQGAAGATGAQGAPGPNLVSADTATTLTGVLAGSGGKVTTAAVDSAPNAAHTANLITSAAVADAVAKEILYFGSQAVTAANGGEIFRITDGAVTADTVVLGCVFANPAAVTSAVTWTSHAGYVVFTGTCTAATTAAVILGKKGNG